MEWMHDWNKQNRWLGASYQRRNRPWKNTYTIYFIFIFNITIPKCEATHTCDLACNCSPSKKGYAGMACFHP